MSLLRWALSAWRSRKDNHNRFTQLNIGGVVLWRWRFISNNPTGLTPYCPTCDSQLVFDIEYSSTYPVTVQSTVLICERCNRNHPVLREDGTYEGIVKRVSREIDRLIRTGEWRRHVPDSLPK
jgi:hypothetical protein